MVFDRIQIVHLVIVSTICKESQQGASAVSGGGLLLGFEGPRARRLHLSACLTPTDLSRLCLLPWKRTQCSARSWEGCSAGCAGQVHAAVEAPVCLGVSALH